MKTTVRPSSGAGGRDNSPNPLAAPGFAVKSTGNGVTPADNEQCATRLDPLGGAAMNDADHAVGWIGSVLENTSSAIIAVDTDGTVMLVNAEAERLTGFGRTELVGSSLGRILPAEFSERVLAGSGRSADPAEGMPDLFSEHQGSLLLRHVDGTDIPVEVNVAHTGGENPTYVVTLRDITYRRDAEMALRFSSERLTKERQAIEDLATYQRVLDRIARGEPRDQTLIKLCDEVEERLPGAICTVMTPDESGSVLHVAAAPSMHHDVSATLAGLPIEDGIGACGTAAATGEVSIVDDTLTDPRTAHFLELARSHNLRAVWSSPLYDTDGKLLGTFAIYRQVPHTPDEAELKMISAAAGLAALAIQRAESERALRTAAECDSLTGLPTRAVFLTRLNEILSRAESQVAVMFLDLDRFKWINDSIGHPSGDDILIAVAARLSDAVGEKALLARFGGDEFTIALSPGDRSSADELAERVEAAIGVPLVVGGREFYLSVSIGIAISEPHMDASGLVRDADAAMYAAKRRSGTRRVVFDRPLRDSILQRVSRENELRRAIERGELTMEYQPIKRMSDGVVTAFEALVRWDHPELGRLGPLEFIPLAEETGLIVPLGAHVIDLVVRDTQQIMDAAGDVHVGVNVSAIQLDDPNFVATVAESLDRYGVEPIRLVIELTESAFMERFDPATSAVQRLVDMGMEIVIDDFGTGYSSISRLSELPVTGVKMDRSFTRNITHSGQAEAVLGSITRLAHAFELRVIAEGIESQHEYEIARQLGCDFGQGYYIARPMPIGEVRAGIA